MTSKKPHTKSRLGCKQCKSRRIKCDEANEKSATRKPPRCGNCTQKGLECDFQQYAAVFENIQVLTPTSFRNPSPPEEPAIGETPSTAAQPPEIQQTPFSFSIEDLGLLHHFTLYTAYTIPVIDSELYCHIWRQEVPRLAQSHGFLMHALLGFAAAHQIALSDVDPLLRDYSVVRHHYSRALTLFREAVSVVDGEQAEALLAFSLLISFLTLYLEFGTPAEGSDPMAGVVTFLKVVQNSTRVINQVRDSLRTSTIGVLLSHTWNKQPHAIGPATEQSLHVLDGLACDYLSSTTYPSPASNTSSPSSNSNTADTLLDALSKLRQLFALSDPKEKGWSFILAWPINLDPSFITLLQDDNPIALCALAHWCVPIYHAPTKWFTRDWPRRMLRAVEARVRGTMWEEGIRWPLNETIGDVDGGLIGFDC